MPPHSTAHEGTGNVRALPSATPRATHDFHSIYEAWHGEVARWVRALGGPECEKDDLVQDVFLIVHRRLEDFDGRNVAGWLYRITRHRVRDLRCRLWFKHLLSGGSPVPESVPQPGACPGESFETKQKYQALELSLAKLYEPERVALMLFELDGYSGEEISEIQGVSVNTVWSRIRRARGKLNSFAAEIEQRGFADAS